MLTTNSGSSILSNNHNLNLNQVNKSPDFKETGVNHITISIVGDPKSGKTSLIECFLNDKIEDKNIETVLKIYHTKVSVKNFNLNIILFDISGYFERDKDLVNEYIKYSNIIILCHSLEEEFNEDTLTEWLYQIEARADVGRNYIYLVGTKYDIKVMQDYQKGSSVPSLIFPNGNLASFGEKIKNYINKNSVKDYFIVSSLLSFNVKETFQSIITDYIHDRLIEGNKKGVNKENNQNCFIY